MTFLPTLHFIFICVWLGVVLVETVLEFSGRAELDLRKAAELHFWIDLMIEFPIVSGVLITGIILTVMAGSLSQLMWIKIAMGLVAIASNIYCGALVMIRYRRRSDPAALLSLTRRICQCWVGVPFGLTAFYLGMKLAGIL